MAKKIVRGITDVKTINNQDFDTNNVNDLLSDGQYNYIHRKKGENEEYHNLTDNIKTISSDNTELLSVTNNNKTTNTATLSPKHDAQKEQVLESTRDTVTIHHGTNGTAEKTTVDTNPQKVLEHENLKTGDGLTTSFNTDETTIMFKATKKPPETNLNTLGEGVIRGRGFSIDQVPGWNKDRSAAYVTINTSDDKKVQFHIRDSIYGQGKISLYYRFIINDEVTQWNQMVGDSVELNNQLAQKQDTLTAGEGITIQGNTIDTNPLKVLEHENLISDSEYITLEHQTGENTTHIQTAALKEQLDGLQGRMLELYDAISSIGGERSSIEDYVQQDQDQEVQCLAYKHTITSASVGIILTTFTFECYNAAEIVLTGKLKEDLERHVRAGMSVSNGALTLTNDGTNVKLINSAVSQNAHQQGTFTFFVRITSS